MFAFLPPSPHRYGTWPTHPPRAVVGLDEDVSARLGTQAGGTARIGAPMRLRESGDCRRFEEVAHGATTPPPSTATPARRPSRQQPHPEMARPTNMNISWRPAVSTFLNATNPEHLPATRLAIAMRVPPPMYASPTEAARDPHRPRCCLEYDRGSSHSPPNNSHPPPRSLHSKGAASPIVFAAVAQSDFLRIAHRHAAPRAQRGPRAHHPRFDLALGRRSAGVSRGTPSSTSSQAHDAPTSLGYRRSRAAAAASTTATPANIRSSTQARPSTSSGPPGTTPSARERFCRRPNFFAGASRLEVPYIVATHVELWTPRWVDLGMPRSERQDLIWRRGTELITHATLPSNALTFWTPHALIGQCSIASVLLENTWGNSQKIPTIDHARPDRLRGARVMASGSDERARQCRRLAGSPSCASPMTRFSVSLQHGGLRERAPRQRKRPGQRAMRRHEQRRRLVDSPPAQRASAALPPTQQSCRSGSSPREAALGEGAAAHSFPPRHGAGLLGRRQPLSLGAPLGVGRGAATAPAPRGAASQGKRKKGDLCEHRHPMPCHKWQAGARR